MDNNVTLDPAIVIDIQAREIAQITHRAILAEAAVDQLQKQNKVLLDSITELQSTESEPVSD